MNVKNPLGFLENFQLYIGLLGEEMATETLEVDEKRIEIEKEPAI